MRILAVGGTSSGVGKTDLICILTGMLPGWGVLKTSVRSGKKSRSDLPPETYEIVTGRSELLVPDKDTWRYNAAGAARVAWLRTGPDGLAEGVPRALGRFRDLPGVLVEGNSHSFHRTPDRMILVARSSLEEIKPTARQLMPEADLVLLNADGGRAMNRKRLLEEGGARRILERNLRDPRLPGELQGLLATWFPP